ncbi:MAG: hypothetical protein A2X32_03390 [Elusimicrobia bacterium GWC2_64_44]|nr:MAG: hypothetical protein A2X32_03390 [Elusimicrobia bacterium GWC2_64_44]
MDSRIDQNVVVVCGVTGQQGGAVARELLLEGYSVRGLTRDPEQEKAAELKRMGVQLVKCDLNNTAEVIHAMKGAWGAFGVFTGLEGGAIREEQQALRFAVIAKNTGVKHYVYSSVASADRNTGIPFFENKARVEKTVKTLNFGSYTILRPAFFMENFRSPLMWPELERGRLSVALRPETKLQMVAVEDIGRYACLAFTKCDELNREVINLAGDEITMPQAAAILSDALNKHVEYSRLPIETLRAFNFELSVMYEWFDRAGLGVDIPKLRRAYGLEPLTLRQWAAKVKWPVAAR